MERRNTKQRQIILDAVRSRCDHPTANEIFSQVSKKYPNISLGTVYRNLDILAELGEINKIKLNDADRFDLTVVPHNHFYCTKCKRIFDIDVPYSVKEDDRKIEGFYIESHQTIYSGICPDCQE